MMIINNNKYRKDKHTQTKKLWWMDGRRLLDYKEYITIHGNLYNKYGGYYIIGKNEKYVSADCWSYCLLGNINCE